MPTITRITPQKTRPNRRNVFLDGAFAFGVHLNVVAQFNLRVGLGLTSQQVAEIEAGEVRQECLDQALKTLASRPHSVAELKTKLRRGEYGEAVIDRVTEDLKRLGYLDDGRFARAKAQSAAEHRQHGRRRAFSELRKAGVAEDVARQALEDVYGQADTLAVAHELARKQAPRLKKLPLQTARRRLVGMLQRRGFDYDEIKSVVDEALGNHSEE